MHIEKSKHIKFLLLRCKALKENMIRTLSDNSTDVIGRYTSYKHYAEEHACLAKEVCKTLDLTQERILSYDTEKMKGPGDTTWSYQRQIIESLVTYTDTLIAFLERENGFIEDEYSNITNFLSSKLRNAFYDTPQSEKEVQNAIELLFVGKGWQKGTDFYRESGHKFSGRDYIPDFTIPKLELCLEVKLLKDESRKSKVIEEINADITAYSKEYKRQLFLIYDIGIIRDEIEFKHDIENSQSNIKVIIVKH